jgi:hypothetical protein
LLNEDEQNDQDGIKSQFKRTNVRKRRKLRTLHSGFILVFAGDMNRFVETFISVGRHRRNAVSTALLFIFDQSIDVEEYIIDKQDFVLLGPSDTIRHNSIRCNTTTVATWTMHVEMERVVVVCWDRTFHGGMTLEEKEGSKCELR